MLNAFRTRTKPTAPPLQRSEYLIELVDVVKSYPTATGPFLALNDINLQVIGGEFVAVIGKSGSGKSTLINMLTGIDRPTSGEIYVNHTAIHNLNEQEIAIWRGTNVGLVFQFFQLLPTLTAAENVMLPMDFCNTYTPREWRARALELLALVELSDQADKRPSEMSGGQQQRLAIARALANDPPLLIADEPTGNLDSQTAATVFALFEHLVDRGKTVLVVTHDIDLAKQVNRTLIIADGEIMEEYAARAFPHLSQELLIWITRHMKRKRFAPGTVILKEGEVGENFYLITDGQVEVIVYGPNQYPIVVSVLSRGQFFGEIELLRGSQNVATVRAAEPVGAEVAMLSSTVFHQLIEQTRSTEADIAGVAEERLAENLAARSGIEVGDSASSN